MPFTPEEAQQQEKMSVEEAFAKVKEEIAKVPGADLVIGVVNNAKRAAELAGKAAAVPGAAWSQFRR